MIWNVLNINELDITTLLWKIRYVLILDDWTNISLVDLKPVKSLTDTPLSYNWNIETPIFQLISVISFFWEREEEGGGMKISQDFIKSKYLKKTEIVDGTWQ